MTFFLGYTKNESMTYKLRWSIPHTTCFDERSHMGRKGRGIEAKTVRLLEDETSNGRRDEGYAESMFLVT